MSVNHKSFSFAFWGSVAKPGGYLSMSYVMLTIIHSDDRHYLFLDRRTKEHIRKYKLWHIMNLFFCSSV